MDVQNIAFCPAGAEDIPIIFSFAKDLIDRYEDVSAIPYQSVLQWMLDKITNNISLYQCIVIDGIKAGYFYFQSNGRESELDDLYIFPEYRGRGVGSSVLRYCIQQVDHPIFLYVFRKNTDAIRLYKKMGFATAETVGNTRMIMRYEG